MQRDQKVGLALSVLLIGAVAALFFRIDPRPAGPIPELKTAAAIDERLAERPYAPYSSARDPLAIPTARIRRVSHPDSGVSLLPTLEAPDTSDEPAELGSRDLLSRSAPPPRGVAPDPIGAHRDGLPFAARHQHNYGTIPQPAQH